MHITALLAVAAVVNGQTSSDNASGRREYANLTHCVISLIDHAELSAQEAGILTELTAKEGDIVKADQVLGKIDDTDALAREKVAKAKLASAHERATNDAPLRVAKKLIEYTLAEWEESKAINNRAPGSIPEATLRRQKVSWEKTTLEALVNQMEFIIAGFDEKVAEAELEGVQNELARRTLQAPFDGVIVQLYRQQSEWVRGGDPVLRIVRMDRLRAEGFLNADEYAPAEVVGAKVTITVSLAGEQKATFQSTISHVSPLVEASGDYRIWAEVDNPPGRGEYPWLLRPGSEAEMLIQLKRAPAVATR
jgi:macrolide-specific efflux system membrane fusion protein